MSSDCPSLESALASCIWSLAALTEAGDVTMPPVTRPTAGGYGDCYSQNVFVFHASSLKLNLLIYSHASM